jgi:transposase-like protein
MEKNTTARSYTDLEREELIEQWKQSGQSKAAFCKELSVSYCSFNDWIKRKHKKEKSGKPSFVPLKIKTSSQTNFATLISRSGLTVNLHQPVASSYLLALLKA